MKERVFTFWEGDMPAYLKLCLNTWKFDYTILTYENLNEYTNLDIDKLKRFTLPQIADIVRVHVLRDSGGYWLDADTIMVTSKLPTETMIGYPTTRANTIGYLHAKEAHEPMFEEWAKYQDEVINNDTIPLTWDVVGNAFTDRYVKEHPEITIADVSRCWAETYLAQGITSRYSQYRQVYFARKFTLSDFEKTDMIMLHNSWTPEWYKGYSVYNIQRDNCTMSNLLKELAL